MPLKVIRDTEPKIEADIYIPECWKFSETDETFSVEKLQLYYKTSITVIN